MSRELLSGDNLIVLINRIDVLWNNSRKIHDICMRKSTVSITVKLSADDEALLTKAAEAIWPGAMMTRSSVLLSLAKLGAEAALSKQKTSHKSV